VGRGSVDRTATCYGLDGSGIESRLGDLPHLSKPALSPIQPPVKWVPSLFPGSKATGAWRWPQPIFSAEVKERIQLYFYFSCGPSWPDL